MGDAVHVSGFPLSEPCPRLHFSSSWTGTQLRHEHVLAFCHLSHHWWFSQVILSIGFNWLVKYRLKICIVFPWLPSKKGFTGEQGVLKTNACHIRSLFFPPLCLFSFEILKNLQNLQGWLFVFRTVCKEPVSKPITFNSWTVQVWKKVTAMQASMKLKMFHYLVRYFTPARWFSFTEM